MLDRDAKKRTKKSKRENSRVVALNYSELCTALSDWHSDVAYWALVMARTVHSMPQEVKGVPLVPKTALKFNINKLDQHK